MEAYTLEDGIEKIFELAVNVQTKPALICFYGHANAGKSTLRKECVEIAWELGLRAHGGMIDDERSYSNDGYKLDYIFLEAYTDPLKHRSAEFIGKPIDISVVIVNTKLNSPRELAELQYYCNKGEYDFVICNPFSKVKSCNKTEL